MGVDLAIRAFVILIGGILLIGTLASFTLAVLAGVATRVALGLIGV